MSSKEEADLEELLDMFAMGIGDVHEFEERLQAEYTALEVQGLRGGGEGGDT